jgi:hypothetical protein
VIVDFVMINGVFLLISYLTLNVLNNGYVTFMTFDDDLERLALVVIWSMLYILFEWHAYLCVSNYNVIDL